MCTYDPRKVPQHHITGTMPHRCPICGETVTPGKIHPPAPGETSPENEHTIPATHFVDSDHNMPDDKWFR